jgi:hypothetical protein
VPGKDSVDVRFGRDGFIDGYIMLTTPGGCFEVEECITLFLEEVAVRGPKVVTIPVFYV